VTHAYPQQTTNTVYSCVLTQTFFEQMPSLNSRHTIKVWSEIHIKHCPQIEVVASIRSKCTCIRIISYDGHQGLLVLYDLLPRLTAGLRTKD